MTNPNQDLKSRPLEIWGDMKPHALMTAIETSQIEVLSFFVTKIKSCCI